MNRIVPILVITVVLLMTSLWFCGYYMGRDSIAKDSESIKRVEQKIDKLNNFIGIRIEGGK